MYLNKCKAEIIKELFSIFYLFSSFYLCVSKNKVIIQVAKRSHVC